MTVEVIHGDSRVVLATLASASCDAIVTDPPYELGFMGKSWDSSGIAYDVALWREALRVAKPGAFLAAFGGTRTYHRMACAIEDAGFEIRDSLHWIYGTGMPKSHNVSKAIDKQLGSERPVTGTRALTGKARVLKGGNFDGGYEGRELTTEYEHTAPGSPEAAQWDGWGTALKPSHEPIVIARKPLIGTVATNVLTHGTGGLNVDACRIPASGRPNVVPHINPRFYDVGVSGGSHRDGTTDQGRWPPNTLLQHDHAEDEPCAEPCPVAVIDARAGVRKSGSRAADRTMSSTSKGDGGPALEASEGGASRFFPVFYSGKASSKDRGEGNTHPTVKPLAVMRWLVRLVTPPGGKIVDPFAGSGTTLLAARAEGFDAVGIELEAAHVEIIRARLTRAEPAQSSLFARTA